MNKTEMFLRLKEDKFFKDWEEQVKYSFEVFKYWFENIANLSTIKRINGKISHLSSNMISVNFPKKNEEKKAVIWAFQKLREKYKM
jgi:hypothetical protein